MIQTSEIVFSGHDGSIGSNRPKDSRIVTSLLESPLETKIKELKGLDPLPKAFIHLAAMAAVKDCENQPELCHKLNVDGAAQWFQACQEVGIEKFIFTSTSHVYSVKACHEPLNTNSEIGPQNEYGKSKLEAELLLQKLRAEGPCKLYIARVFSVLADPGPEWSLLEGLKRRARNRDFSPIPGLSNIRDFLTNTEVCDQLVQIARSDKSLPMILNVCSGKGTKIRDLAEKVFLDHNLSLDNLKEAENQGGVSKIVGIPTPL